MRSIYVIGIISIIFFLYGSINYYIGLRGWQVFGTNLTFINKKIYWIIFWLVVVSYIIGRLGEKFISGFNGKYFLIIGGYWLAAMYYFLITLLIIDLFRFFDKWVRVIPEGFRNNPNNSLYTGILVLVMVVAILIYGTWNAQNPQITHYDLTIPKQAKNLAKLHIVMVSDIHLGQVVDNKHLLKMVNKINDLQPDLVVFAGDMVDENVDIFIEQKMTDTFKLLKPKLGSYAVLGNHEYIGGHVEDIIYHLEQGGIEVLRDSYRKIADSFYLVGRDELVASHFAGQERQPLSHLLKGIDKSLPIILLDHQPSALVEARENGVDLQFSGHTHQGQFFPNNLVTARIFEVHWGYLNKDGLQVIVSSGYGTWGPPIRIGNKPEIVDVVIEFGTTGT